MNKIEQNYLEKISQDNYDISRSYNIRKNGKGIERKITENVNIITKSDKDGIDVIVKDDTKYDLVYIPVIIDAAGLEDVVYNDFYIGKNANVLIVAGCGIFNNCKKTSKHNGVHRFYLEKNAKVKYIENHYGERGDGENIMDPVTEIYLKDNSYFEMVTSQIKGINNTNRITKAVLDANSTLIINEKIMTTDDEIAKTNFEVKLNGENTHCHLTSRAVAEKKSVQSFTSVIEGNNKCYARSECDAIIKDKAQVTALPIIKANNEEANLIHEAAIGKIAGEQLLKLMTLGLSKKKAEETIIKGFLN